jgi:hypothetical protein
MSSVKSPSAARSLRPPRRWGYTQSAVSRQIAALERVANTPVLDGQRWIASPSAGEDKMMGVWPGLDERPEIAHTTRD